MTFKSRLMLLIFTQFLEYTPPSRFELNKADFRLATIFKKCKLIDDYKNECSPQFIECDTNIGIGACSMGNLKMYTIRIFPTIAKADLVHFMELQFHFFF